MTVSRDSLAQNRVFEREVGIVPQKTWYDSLRNNTKESIMHKVNLSSKSNAPKRVSTANITSGRKRAASI